MIGRLFLLFIFTRETKFWSSVRKNRDREINKWGDYTERAQGEEKCVARKS